MRIGDVSGDLFAQPGSTLNILFPQPTVRTARSLGNTTRVDLEFHDMDVMDINALATDLNERVDAFIAEDLATDQAAGMQAVGVRRSNDAPPDTAAPNVPPRCS
ncbi:MAG: hypothetical protein IPO05_16660 [Flavobacteriales bacterium]|nr:hypothetical protein [Flavobacteriales bacterium]